MYTSLYAPYKTCLLIGLLSTGKLKVMKILGIVGESLQGKNHKYRQNRARVAKLVDALP